MEGMTNVKAGQKTHKQNNRQRENVHTGHLLPEEASLKMTSQVTDIGV